MEKPPIVIFSFRNTTSYCIFCFHLGISTPILLPLTFKAVIIIFKVNTIEDKNIENLMDWAIANNSSFETSLLWLILYETWTLTILHENWKMYPSIELNIG